MTVSEIKKFFSQQMASVRDDYVKDLQAMSHEQLAASPGGVARSAYDVTYEAAYINRRITKRIKGETPPPVTDEGWIIAPADYKDKEKAIADLRTSMDDLIAAWDALPEDQMGREIDLPNGDKTFPLDVAFMAIYHTGYHDAQLNYIQSINGDGKWHWGD